jgi:hypothetical protein
MTMIQILAVILLAVIIIIVWRWNIKEQNKS